MMFPAKPLYVLRCVVQCVFVAVMPLCFFSANYARKLHWIHLLSASSSCALRGSIASETSGTDFILGFLPMFTARETWSENTIYAKRMRRTYK